MSLVVRVPATTANLGPGFDVLGMALGLWNEIHVEPASSLQITVYGEGGKRCPGMSATWSTRPCAPWPPRWGSPSRR